jgi:phosphinothricin acetyltransferase
LRYLSAGSAIQTEKVFAAAAQKSIIKWRGASRESIHTGDEDMSEMIEEYREEHLAELTEIYNYYVLNTTATWHTQPMTADDMRKLVVSGGERYKTFVLTEGRCVCGYVSIREFKPRDAYIGTAEIGIYFRPEYCGRGLGDKAVQHIETYAKSAGFHVLIAAISGENTASIRLFEKNGYEKCAHYREVGIKFGKRLDAVSYQKILD